MDKVHALNKKLAEMAAEEKQKSVVLVYEPGKWEDKACVPEGQEWGD
jgi:hypothetical protein